jgi:hypothetical protein
MKVLVYPALEEWGDVADEFRRILPTLSLSQFFTFFSLDCSYLHYQVQLNILQILLHLWPLQKELGGFLDVPPFPYQIYLPIYIQESSQNFILT